MAEAFDEEFLDGGTVALKETDGVGRFSSVNDGALDAGLFADEEQWQAILGHETRSVGIDCRADRDRFALTGKRIFLKPEAE